MEIHFGYLLRETEGVLTGRWGKSPPESVAPLPYGRLLFLYWA